MTTEHKEDLESQLNIEYSSLKTGYDTAKARREIFYKEYQFQSYGNEKKGQSALVDSTIFDTIEWMVPSLIQPFMETNEWMSIEPEGANAMDVITAEVHRELLTFQLRKKNPWYQILHDVIKATLIQGESYIRVTWIKRDKAMGESVSRPKLNYVNASKIRYDWTVQNFLDSRVVTFEEDRTRGDLMSEMDGMEGLDQKAFDKALEAPGRNDKTARLRQEEQNSKGWVGEDNTRKNKDSTLYLYREQWTDYDFEGKGKTERALGLFIDDKLVFFDKSPLPTNRPPFFKAEAVRDILGNPATGWAQNLSDIQKFKTGLLRLMSDNMNSQQNGMYEVDRTNVDEVGMLLLQNAPQGSRVAIPVRKPGSINSLAPAPIAAHAFQIWELLEVAKENRSGATRYSQGLDSKSLNQTATGIVAITQRSEMRMWEFATRFSEMVLKPLTNTIIAFNQTFLEDQDLQLQFGLPEVIITRPDGTKEVLAERKAKDWIQLNKKDLGGYFTVNIDVKVGSSKQQEIDNLLQWAQFFAPFVGAGVPKEAVAVIATEAAKLMGVTKVELIMQKEIKDNVGTRGISVPVLREEGAGGNAGGQGLPSTGVEEIEGGGGVPPDNGQLLETGGAGS